MTKGFSDTERKVFDCDWFKFITNGCEVISKNFY